MSKIKAQAAYDTLLQEAEEFEGKTENLHLRGERSVVNTLAHLQESQIDIMADVAGRLLAIRRGGNADHISDPVIQGHVVGLRKEWKKLEKDIDTIQAALDAFKPVSKAESHIEHVRRSNGARQGAR